MSKNNKKRLADRLDEIIQLERGGLSRAEIGQVLALRDKREQPYSEGGIRHAMAKALSERCKELFGE